MQLITIAFEKQYKTNNDHREDIYSFNELLIFVLIFILTFILFIYITLSFSNFFESKIDDADNFAEKIQELSNSILTGLHCILILCGLFSIFFSPYSNFIYKDIKKLLENNYYIYPAILQNKFFYFTFNYNYISICDDNKNLELLSGTLIISIYLAIGNFIISYIMDYSQINIYFIQYIPSYIPSIIFVFLSSYLFYIL